MRDWLARAGVVSILAIDATAVTQTPREVFEGVAGSGSSFADAVGT